MSRLRQIPAKLLCLAAVCLLAVGTTLPPSAQRSPGTTPPAADVQPGHLRYPADLVHQQSAIALAGFTFDAPPLPPPRPSLPEAGKNEPTPVRQEAADKAGDSPKIQTAAHVRRPTPKSIVRRLPPMPEPRETAQPVATNDYDKPAAGDKRTQVWRLPPVVVAKGPIVTTDRLQPNQTPAASTNGPVVKLAAKPVVTVVSPDPVGLGSEHSQPTLQIKPELPTQAAPRPRRNEQVVRRIPGPNPALVAVSRQAMDLVRNGHSLAVRNAQYSARADFVQALRLIAQAHDAMKGGAQHSQDLAAGLLALREAQEFIPQNTGRWTDQFDVQVIAATHGTPVLRQDREFGPPQATMTTWQARQSYYTFAQQKLTRAAAGDAVASAALSSLGKLYVGRDGTSGEENLVSSAQAMVFFQAALQVDSRNYTAANELGVLLARYGQLQNARKVLQHGVAIEKDFPPLWRNLAVVHQRLGEIDLERRARHEFNLALQRAESGEAGSDVTNTIRWVDAESFAGPAARPTPPRTAAQPVSDNSRSETRQPGWRFWK